MRRIFAVGAVALCWITNANGQEDNAADLAKTLSNPVADLISIPFSSTTMTASAPSRTVHKPT